MTVMLKRGQAIEVLDRGDWSTMIVTRGGFDYFEAHEDEGAPLGSGCRLQIASEGVLWRPAQRLPAMATVEVSEAEEEEVEEEPCQVQAFRPREPVTVMAEASAFLGMSCELGSMFFEEWR